ncbi:MAG: site-specific integrase [Janthinobacterium lividum]
MRAWCDWCHRHALPCLPADPADVVAFLAAERGRGLSVTTVELRRAAIRYLHFIAGCLMPTGEALMMPFWPVIMITGMAPRKA